MKRPLFRALTVGIIFVITYYAIQVFRGIYLTYKYVPDIIESYDSVNYLQHKVSFGVSVDSMRVLIEILGLLLLGASIYFGVRRIRRNKYDTLR
ncbi:hypothetical protein [Paenibacillus sp. FSL W7-1287]|uniref:hypothetical protein n=1 Tax=Paenibacillus sp. FSL W7-1287 TaxID=2954538 RepID=UPI0030F7DDA5